jgi:plasmid stability protein
MSKTFLLHIPDREHQALKIAAAQVGASMNQFIRDAIMEKIAGQNVERSAPAPESLPAADAETSDSGALAEAATRNPPNRRG